MNIEKELDNAILEPKKAPNRLVAEDPKNDDNSIATMHESKMKELKIINGDPVILRGKRRNETLCIAIWDNTIEGTKLGINKVVWSNIRVRLGDLVTVRPAPEVPNLKKIHILPYKDSIEGLSGNIAQIYL